MRHLIKDFYYTGFFKVLFNIVNIVCIYNVIIVTDKSWNFPNVILLFTNWILYATSFLKSNKWNLTFNKYCLLL